MDLLALPAVFLFDLVDRCDILTLTSLRGTSKAMRDEIPLYVRKITIPDEFVWHRVDNNLYLRLPPISFILDLPYAQSECPLYGGIWDVLAIEPESLVHPSYRLICPSMDTSPYNNVEWLLQTLNQKFNMIFTVNPRIHLELLIINNISHSGSIDYNYIMISEGKITTDMELMVPDSVSFTSHFRRQSSIGLIYDSIGYRNDSIFPFLLRCLMCIVGTPYYWNDPHQHMMPLTNRRLSFIVGRVFDGGTQVNSAVYVHDR